MEDGLFLSYLRSLQLTALGTMDLLKVDPADLVRRNRESALRADSVE